MNRLTMLIGCIAAAVPLALSAWMLVQWLRDRGIHPFRALAKFLPRSAVERLLLVCVAVGFFHYGATKETNAPPRGASGECRVESVKESVECKVESVELRNGQSYNSTLSTFNSPFRLESVTTNDSYSFLMPSNGVRYANWWLRGAYEDVFRLDLGEMRFPCGTNLCDSLWVYTWGMAGARLGDASNRLVATGAPMSAVPGLSQFWSVDVDGGAKLLTWENFFLNRDTNTPVSAQLELMPSGDFIARSNLVETVYRRVNPDDWDDDGIPNDDDLDPLSYDGDNFGPHQQLPEGANSNAYCWVDLVVAQADSLVAFTGDAPSALPDPTFIAKAGATNRVTILIGKTYQVTSRMPIACVGQSSGEIEVWQVSPMELSICWPVTIEASAMRSDSSFSMSVWPDWLGGGFTWTNSCCAVMSIGGWSYGFTCAANCLCTGCGAEGYYGYESYRLPAYGGTCGCSPHGDGADTGGDEEPLSVGVSVSFSKDAVIFEDAYVPSPGESVQKRSTTVKLRVSAYGGPNGGTVSFTATNLDKLSPLACGPLLLPSNLVLAPMETYSEEFKCEGAVASGAENDIVVSGSFVENVTVETYDAQDRITVFRVDIRSVTWPEENPYVNRHRFGLREPIHILQLPPSPALQKSNMGGGRIMNDGRYQCPIEVCANPITFCHGNAEYTPCLQVIAPECVYVGNVTEKVYAVSGEAGGIGMELDMFLKPFDVSFHWIAVEEVPSLLGEHEGYFSNRAFESDWSHTRAAGAGRWLNVEENNHYGMDVAALSNSLPRMTSGGVLTNDVQFGWQYGTIVWQVPIGWGEDNSSGLDEEVGLLPTTETQQMVIFPDGKCGVRKFRHMVTREVDGTVYLDGRRVR